ncbi:MAG: ornithine--oxo-acid transaminase [Oligoflexia bacterium]|nr:ornithine--oxo-acid transaminase [Oligoflexia bacterium]
MGAESKRHIDLVETFGAHNYGPLDVVLSHGEGAWVTDVDGKRYLDMLSAYSALNFGHRHPRLMAAALRQMERLTMTSRAFYNDQFGPFCEELAQFCGMQMVLAMNSGAEAVETAIKAARRWGYEKKGVLQPNAHIICFDGNFHGRTTTIVSFSTEADSREGYAPFTPGFSLVPFGDVGAVAKAITPNTVAVLVEPIQGEGGVIIPPNGFMRELRKLCTENRVLLIADEIQTGLCRTGAYFCCDHEQVKPDIYLLAKSLGGGIIPVSAAISSSDILGVFTPGSHGSTFGGNPLGCAIAREVLQLIKDDKPELRSRELGDYFIAELKRMRSGPVTEVRGKGLFVGMDIDPAYGPAKKLCKALKKHGILAKDTRKQTVRFAPPLIIEKADLDLGLEKIEATLKAEV